MEPSESVNAYHSAKDLIERGGKVRVSGSGKCRSCGAEVVWGTYTQSGKRAPFDFDGTNHFATCPDAASHRRPR